MNRSQFNTGWTVAHTDAPDIKQTVILPHDAMLSETRSEDSPGGKNTGWYAGRDYLYEKTFVPDDELRGKAVILEFEGVYHNAEVWLNGRQAAFHSYGYTGFYVDISDALLYGQENLIQVLCRNSDQPNSRWYSGAGIYRPVYMWTGSSEHIAVNGIRVRTLGISPAVIAVDVAATGSAAVNVEICDGGHTICSASGTGRLLFTINNAVLWSADTPKLYTCRALYGDDSASVAFGIRSVEAGKDGLLINGQRTMLRGACVHHDNGILGACCFEEAERRKVRLLRECGYNAIRSAHNPCSKALLDACDELGMYVADEYADMWYIHKTRYDYAEHFETCRNEDLTAMAEKDFNHPSVILYSIGNEVTETAQRKGIALTKEMTQFLHALDDTRPVTCGVNIFFNLLSSIGLGVYSDRRSRRNIRQSAGSGFYNNIAGLLGAPVMKLGALLPGCGAKTEGAFAGMDIAGYNYGIRRYRHDLKKYPGRLILGTETFCADAYAFWELAQKEKRLIGDFVWSGIDYLGETGLGAWEYSDYAPRYDGGCGWISAGAGRLDLTGTPLGEAYYTRVAFGLDKGPFIAVRPVSHTGEKHSPSAWRMSNAIPSWSWRGCAGKRADVEVYARAYGVALFINGCRIGYRRLKNRCVARFSCIYYDGTAEAVAYDRAGNETGRNLLRTAAEKTVLRLEPGQDSVRAGGLCYIRIRYTDVNGILKPLERHTLRVCVTGGTLLGLGSGCPHNVRGFTKDITDTYYGQALAAVRASQSGYITFTVTDGSLYQTAVIDIV